MVEMGVRNSWEREFKIVLYNMIVFARPSSSKLFFSIILILYVRTAFTIAITKYIINISVSSPSPMESVKRGGMKKKSQRRALIIEAITTGTNSNSIARIETQSKRINATMRYGIYADNPKQRAVTKTIMERLMRY